MTTLGEFVVHPIWLLPAFLCGLIFGSFYNVCIIRIPEEKSLLGRSRCTKCMQPVVWYHNIPILSYLFLRGRCHYCSKKISVQYPLVELATGILFSWLFLHFGFGLELLFYCIFTSLLLIISVIDFHHQIIPDELSLGGMGIGFISSFILNETIWWESLLGIVIGGGCFFAVAYLYELLAKREGLGGGDIKFLAMIGAWLSYHSILVVVIISSAVGSFVGGGMMLMRRGNLRTAIPFGPFLALGAFIYLFWGDFFQSVLFPWGWGE